MSKWRLPAPNRPFHPKSFLGIPQTFQAASLSICIEQNRGTENDMIAFTDDGIISWEVAPPGQSGFIAPDGTKSPHYDDQLKMYESFGRKRMWITEKETYNPEEQLFKCQCSKVISKLFFWERCDRKRKQFQKDTTFWNLPRATNCDLLQLLQLVSPFLAVPLLKL